MAVGGFDRSLVVAIDRRRCIGTDVFLRGVSGRVSETDVGVRGRSAIRAAAGWVVGHRCQGIVLNACECWPKHVRQGLVGSHVGAKARGLSGNEKGAWPTSCQLHLAI